MSENEERDAAQPDECLVDQDPDAEEDWSPSFHDEFEPSPIKKVLHRDGLPTQSAPFRESDIPALSCETLVCMEDASKFVLRSVFGDVVAEFTPEEVERSPEGRWRAPWPLVLERFKMELTRYRAAEEVEPELDDKALTMALLASGGAARGFPIRCNRTHIEVEPIRPACKHYARQFLQYDLAPDHRKLQRLCTARRSTDGAFMSVSNTTVAACDLRDPPTCASYDLMDEVDADLIRRGATREHLPIIGGIFDNPEKKS